MVAAAWPAGVVWLLGWGCCEAGVADSAATGWVPGGVPGVVCDPGGPPAGVCGACEVGGFGGGAWGAADPGACAACDAGAAGCWFSDCGALRVSELARARPTTASRGDSQTALRRRAEAVKHPLTLVIHLVRNGNLNERECRCNLFLLLTTTGIETQNSASSPKDLRSLRFIGSAGLLRL